MERVMKKAEQTEFSEQTEQVEPFRLRTVVRFGEFSESLQTDHTAIFNRDHFGTYRGISVRFL